MSSPTEPVIIAEQGALVLAQQRALSTFTPLAASDCGDSIRQRGNPFGRGIGRVDEVLNDRVGDPDDRVGDLNDRVGDLNDRVGDNVGGRE